MKLYIYKYDADIKVFEQEDVDVLSHVNAGEIGNYKLAKLSSLLQGTNFYDGFVAENEIDVAKKVYTITRSDVYVVVLKENNANIARQKINDAIQQEIDEKKDQQDALKWLNPKLVG